MAGALNTARSRVFAASIITLLVGSAVTKVTNRSFVLSIEVGRGVAMNALSMTINLNENVKVSISVLLTCQIRMV